MPFVFQAASDSLKIAELQYATAQTVRFTGFSSCIGVLARKGNLVTAVHLGMMAPPDTWFNDAAANVVFALIPNYDNLVIIGQVEMWRNPPVDAAFAYLLNKFSVRPPVLIDVDDGTYGARVLDGKFQLFQRGNYVQF